MVINKKYQKHHFHAVTKRIQEEQINTTQTKRSNRLETAVYIFNAFSSRANLKTKDELAIRNSRCYATLDTEPLHDISCFFGS